jgi:hypothetical protein
MKKTITKQIVDTDKHHPVSYGVPKFELHGFFLAIAKKFSGKTYTLRHVIKNLVKKGQLNYGIVISSTAEATKDWIGIPENCRFDDWEKGKAAIMNLIAFQKNNIKEGKKAHAFIVLDDIIGLVKHNDTLVNRLASSARHFNISVFAAVQNLKSVSPIVRQNADYVFIFRNSNTNEKKEIYSQWNGSLIGEFSDFNKLMNDEIKDYRVLSIDCKTQTNDAKKIFSVFKAP